MDASLSGREMPPDEQVTALIDEFFERRRSGEDLTVEQFAAQHPEVSDKLAPYLAGMDLIEAARSVASGIEQEESAPGELPSIAGYQLLEEIGRGGMGVVYKAVQLTTKRAVAIKVMLAGPFASPSSLRRFEREVELTARFQHPGIVRVLESGMVEGRPYYAMDLVAGRRLDEFLNECSGDQEALLELFASVCDAVQYAHDQGVVHRDLKPSNVLVDEDGRPHVLDFGLAKTIGSAHTDDAGGTPVSLPGQVLGTLYYLSPEQAAAGDSGEPARIDARTDVYALGVMLYETLTGTLPYDTSGRPSQVMERIREAVPVRPSSRSEHVDGELEAIVLKTLEKEPDRRYSSVRGLAEDIRHYLADEPIRARPPSSLYVFRKKLARHRAAAVLCAAAAVLALAALLFGVRARHQELMRARREILECQLSLDAHRDAVSAGLAKATYLKHPQLREASLVWAQVQYYGESQDKAIRFLESRLQHDPSAWGCAELLASIYRRAGAAELAQRWTLRVGQYFPGTADAWYVRSFATLEPNQALAYVGQAVRLEPGHTLAMRRLAFLQLRTGALDDALCTVNQFIHSGENIDQWEFTKGHILARQGHYREAVTQYTRVIAMLPHWSGAYRMRAHVYRRLGNYEQAIADYGQALQLDGEATANVWDYYQRATPLWIVGRREAALDDYRQVRVRLGHPFYGDARSYVILRELGKSDEAQSLLRRALHDVKDDWLGQVFRTLAGEISGAQLVDAAVRRGNREQICEAYYYAGELALIRGDRERAREWFECCVRTAVEYDLETFPLTPMNETELAAWRLKSLPESASSTSP